MAKTVVIAGDLLVQENLFINESSKLCRARGHSELDVQEEREGAWRVADFVRVALGMTKNADSIVSTPLLTLAASRAVVVWAPFPRVHGQKVKVKDRIWRIE